MSCIRRIENKNGSIRWQIDYVNSDKKRKRKSFNRLRDAKVALLYFSAYHAKNQIDSSKYRLGDLAKRYKKHFKHQKSFFISKQYFIRHIVRYFKEDCLLKAISYEDLQNFQGHLKQVERWRHPRSDLPAKKLKPATVNHIISCLRQMLKQAVSWQMIIENPFDKGDALWLEENNFIDRFLSEDEITRLIDFSPEHLKDIIVCAINSGLRKTELLTLKWDQIKYEDSLIKLPDTKSGKKQFVPMNKRLVELFRKIGKKHAERGINSDYIFLWKNFKGDYVPVLNSVAASLRHSCKRAGIKYGRPDGVTFTILRHTALTYLIKNTKSIFIAKQIARHKRIESTMRYAHIAMDDLQSASNTLNDIC
jgi:integrase